MIPIVNRLNFLSAEVVHKKVTNTLAVTMQKETAGKPRYLLQLVQIFHQSFHAGLRHAKIVPFRDLAGCMTHLIAQ